jgi:hypothetical protein
MDGNLRFILSLSVGIAVIIGIVRFRRMAPSYYPFIFNCIAALFVEILNYILMENGQQKPFVFLLNIFSYVDFFLFTQLFHNWGLFNRKKKTFISIVSVFFVIWVISNTIFTGFIKVNLYFFILYSFALIFFSVSTFNKMVVNERTSIYRNPKFWICLGIIIFYSFFIVYSATGISLFKSIHSMEFMSGLQAINVYSNLLVNLLYAVAVICIPRKKNYTSLF